MQRNSRETELIPAKQEGSISYGKLPKLPSSSRSWSMLKDPRIVRVSRSFGGKDRHSKVRTVRGLRDRRVRLSVQTAIQLYDLQDRLGLSQPSKVVDWLLRAAQQDIDKLPPLQIPFDNFMQPMVLPHETLLKRDSTATGDDQTRRNGEETTDGRQIPTGLLPYASLYHWDAAPVPCLSNLGGIGYSSQTEDQTHSLPPQLLLCPSIFPPYVSAAADYDQKLINHLQMMNSSIQNVRIPFHVRDHRPENDHAALARKGDASFMGAVSNRSSCM